MMFAWLSRRALPNGRPAPSSLRRHLSTRIATSSPRLTLVAHRNDATVKITIAERKHPPVPKRATIHPLTGSHGDRNEVRRDHQPDRRGRHVKRDSDPGRGGRDDGPSRISMKKQPATRSATLRWRASIIAGILLCACDVGRSLVGVQATQEHLADAHVAKRFPRRAPTLSHSGVDASLRDRRQRRRAMGSLWLAGGPSAVSGEPSRVRSVA